MKDETQPPTLPIVRPNFHRSVNLSMQRDFSIARLSRGASSSAFQRNFRSILRIIAHTTARFCIGKFVSIYKMYPRMNFAIIILRQICKFCIFAKYSWEMYHEQPCRVDAIRQKFRFRLKFWSVYITYMYTYIWRKIVEREIFWYSFMSRNFLIDRPLTCNSSY